MRLTPNAVEAVLAGDVNLRPIVQVLDVRCVNVSADRWRGNVSDGVNTVPALFAGQLSALARSGAVRGGTILQLDEYVINNVGGGPRRFAYAFPNPTTVCLDRCLTACCCD